MEDVSVIVRLSEVELLVTVSEVKLLDSEELVREVRLFVELVCVAVVAVELVWVLLLVTVCDLLAVVVNVIVVDDKEIARGS